MFIFQNCRSMKQVQVPNPSRTEILTWINTHVEKLMGTVKKIEDLGNGVAYLFLMSQLRPGSVKTDKIIKNPVNHHEAIQNLKQLSTIFQKLELNYLIQPDKLAQMKYQQNFYLSCFVYRTLSIDFESPEAAALKASENSNNLNKQKKIKILPPQRKVIHNMTKDAPPECTVNDLHALQTGSQRKLKEIEGIMEEEEQSSRQKLEKIAGILGLSMKKHDKKTVSTMTQELANNSLSIEASYKRYLRPSLCERSTFLNSNQVPMSFDKVGKNESCIDPPNQQFQNGPGVICEMLTSNEFEGEMLLSQRKEEVHAEKEECQTRQQIDLVQEFSAQAQKMEMVQQNTSMNA